MTLVQLEYFLRTVENRSFTVAAQQMFISRQAVSANVKALEDELGFPLFQRAGRSIALPDSGEVMYRTLADIQQRFHNGIKDAAARNEKSQDIAIGICQTAEDWIPRLSRFTERYPGCKLDVADLPLATLEKGIIDDRFDIVIAPEDVLPRNTDTGYCLEPLYPLRLIIAISKNHPLAERDHLDFPDLQNECLYTVDEHYSVQTKANILGHFEHLGCHPRDVREFSNYKSLEIALNNGGFCVVFDFFLKNSEGKLKFYPSATLQPIRMSVAYKQNCSPVVKELAQFLKAYKK